MKILDIQLAEINKRLKAYAPYYKIWLEESTALDDYTILHISEEDSTPSIFYFKTKSAISQFSEKKYRKTVKRKIKEYLGKSTNHK